MTAQQAARVETLADNFFGLAATSESVTAGYTGAEEAGAFQLALWEIIYGDYNASNGTVGSSGFTANARTLADVWLTQLVNNQLSDNAALRTLALVRSGRQDQIIQVVVPEASTVVVWSIMVLGLAWSYRRRGGAR